jgi:hypothetical protein
MTCWLLHKRFWVYITSGLNTQTTTRTKPEGDGKVYVYCEKCGKVYSA